MSAPIRRPRRMLMGVEYSRFLQESCGIPKEEADRRAGLDSTGTISGAALVSLVLGSVALVFWAALKGWL